MNQPVHRILSFNQVYKPGKEKKGPVGTAGQAAGSVKGAYHRKLGRETQSGRREAQDKSYWLPPHARFK